MLNYVKSYQYWNYCKNTLKIKIIENYWLFSLFFFPRLYLNPLYNHLSSHWSIHNPHFFNPLDTHFPLHDRSFCFYGLQLEALFLNLLSWCFISPQHLSTFMVSLYAHSFLLLTFMTIFHVCFLFPFLFMLCY